MAGLNDIITSKVRIKILELFYSNPNEMYHVRGAVREVKEEINAVRRDLGRLESAGILKREPRGNRVYYYLRTDYSMYGDLLSIVSKTTGLGFELANNKNKIGKPTIIMFSGTFARQRKRNREDEVDILLVGEVNLPEVATLIRVEESKRDSEINYTVMGREEFEFRKKRRDPFLQGILAASRVMIVGDELNLVS